MKRTVQITKDGSGTIVVEEMNVTYHSIHGAVQESLHVFIEAGLNYVMNMFPDQCISIFEMGFGTGLNALLSLNVAWKQHRELKYFAVEQFPLVKDEWQELNYGKELNLQHEFELLHKCEWNIDVPVNDFFSLVKHNVDLRLVNPGQQFHIVYFDAFAPTAQPELWTREVFEKMFSLLVDGGYLVTYCSKGDVRRAMMAAGFKVEKLKGPPGKREMLRAIKTAE